MKNRYSEVDVQKIIELDLVNSGDFDEDAEWNLCSVYVLEELTEEDKEELIHEVDFEVIRDKGILRVRDLQGGNLANIESEKFKDLDEIIERLSVYWYDYRICIVEKNLFNEIKK